MRINHNVAALNSWRNLKMNNTNMSKSLEKLSSGYRINRAADDPAGLVISEKLRAEISGVAQAVGNTEDAVSMIQVAEGSLVEINTMLNSMRSLALHAANTGAASADAIAADQQQIDSAVDSIASIASNTSYLGRYLLNGSSGNVGTVLDTTKVASVSVGTAPANSTYVNVNVTTSATQATAGVGAYSAIASAATTTAGTFTINGISVTMATTGVTMASATVAINTAFANAGVTNLVAVTGASGVTITNTDWGTTSSINIVDTSHVLFSGTGAAAFTSVGINIAGTINGSAAVGTGLTLTAGAATDYAGTAVTMKTGGITGAITSAFKVVGNAVTFQVGSNITEKQVVNLTDVGPAKLGTAVATNGLLDIKSGAAYALSTDPGTALRVLDAAITSISNTRANLGALTKNVLETKVRSLEISRENLTASESRIRDVDMAQEMMEFTKSQIMMQASTSMLAQANSAPQAILQLLQ